MVAISSISNQLSKSPDGIWRSAQVGPISYTENGHEIIREYEDNSFWFNHRQKCILTLLKNFPTNCILDIGGGNGKNAMLFERSKIETILLEPGESGAKYAFQNGVKNVINSSFHASGFRKESIPAIGLFDVLEHIAEDDLFLKDLFDVLVPKGKLYLTVPAYQVFYSSFDKEVGHFRRYSLKQLTKKLTQSGFEIEYKTYLFCLIPIPMFAVRFLSNFKKGIKKNRDIQHLRNFSFLRRCIEFLLKPEIYFINKKYKIPFGTSCLLVASKPVL